MSSTFKSGDRVRVRVETHPHGYRAGDKVTVLRVATLTATDIHFYLVAMDRDGRETTGIVFNAEDIEPDV
jgi:hypothetical protein